MAREGFDVCWRLATGKFDINKPRSGGCGGHGSFFATEIESSSTATECCFAAAANDHRPTGDISQTRRDGWFSCLLVCAAGQNGHETDAQVCTRLTEVRLLVDQGSESCQRLVHNVQIIMLCDYPVSNDLGVSTQAQRKMGACRPSAYMLFCAQSNRTNPVRHSPSKYRESVTTL